MRDRVQTRILAFACAIHCYRDGPDLLDTRQSADKYRDAYLSDRGDQTLADGWLVNVRHGPPRLGFRSRPPVCAIPADQRFQPRAAFHRGSVTDTRANRAF